MNERIKKLAEQALKHPDNDNDGLTVFDNDELKKFGELILKETISVLQKRFMGDLNREDMEVRRCIADVKKHFGVEE
jgi:hypothetical protein